MLVEKTGMDESQLTKDWLVYEYEEIHVESDIEETVGVRGWQVKTLAAGRVSREGGADNIDRQKVSFAMPQAEQCIVLDIGCARANCHGYC